VLFGEQKKTKAIIRGNKEKRFPPMRKKSEKTQKRRRTWALTSRGKS